MLRWTMFNPFPSWRSLSWTNSGRSEFHRPLWTWSCWNSSSLAHPGRHWRSGTLRGLNHVGKKWELQIWVQLISIDPLVDLVVEHGNGKLLTFLEKIIPKNGWFHRRRISKVQASRRSRWNPNLRSHPSYPQIKHPMWGPKMNQSTPPKKRLLGVDIGMESMAFFVEPT